MFIFLKSSLKFKNSTKNVEEHLKPLKRINTL